MTGIFKHRVIRAIAAAGAGLLTFVAPAAAAPNGVGVVAGTMNFTIGGVPLSPTACDATASGNITAVVIWVTQGSGQRALGTGSLDGSFVTTVCESLLGGAGSFSAHLATGLGVGALNCWLSGPYRRTGVVVQVALTADASLGACTVNSVAANVSSSVVALFLPKHVNTSTDEVDSAAFAGVLTTTG